LVLQVFFTVFIFFENLDFGGVSIFLKSYFMFIEVQLDVKVLKSIDT